MVFIFGLADRELVAMHMIGDYKLFTMNPTGRKDKEDKAGVQEHEDESASEDAPDEE